MNKIKRTLAGLLMVCIALIGVPTVAHAGFVTTERAASSSERDQVRRFFDRSDVRSGLERHGIDAKAAQERVDAMTDQEIAVLAGKIDQMPAGGDALGWILAIVIILIVTDLLGFTKIFPFTRSVR